MVFYINYVSDSFSDKIYENALSNLSDFFEYKWGNQDKPKLYVIPNRRTMDLLKGEKTPSYAVGWSKKDIFILDKNNYAKESSEPYEDKYYTGLIIHELVHAFFDKITGDIHEPMWLSEGIARYLAGENRYQEKPKEFVSFLKFYKQSDDRAVYYESGHAIELLVTRYGKKKLLKLLKSLSAISNKKHFNKVFNQIYNFEPNYKKFNQLLNL